VGLSAKHTKAMVSVFHFGGREEEENTNSAVPSLFLPAMPMKPLSI